MRIDATAVRLRPRPMGEAADLGVRLVQASAGTLWRTAAPVYGATVLLCACLWPLGALAPGLALWLLKPWLDRVLLFVLARAMFRQPTSWADLWAARRPVLLRGLFSGISIRRLSPWRAFTQPAVQLEGLTGAALRRRCALLRRQHIGAAAGTQWGFWHLESALMFGLLGLALWMLPGGVSIQPMAWLFGGGSGDPDHIGTAVFTTAYVLVVAFVEPFYVGAGLAMYVNRRVELEAWDVEQSLRHAFTAA